MVITRRSMLRIFLAVVILAGIIYLSVNQKTVLAQILDSWSIELFLVVVLLLLFQNAAQFATLPALLRPFGIRLSFLESVKVGTWSALLGAIGPLQAGTAYKALYLKLKKQLRAASIAGLLLVLNVLRLLVCLLGAFVSLFALPGEFTAGWMISPSMASVAALLLSTLLVSVVAVAFISSRANFRERIQKFIAAFLLGLRQLLAHPAALPITTGLHVLQLVCNAWIFSLLLEETGYVVPLWLLVGYVCIKYLANLVVLLPFNLGISELLTGLLAEVLGAPLVLGIAVAFQVRIINLLLLGVMTLSVLPSSITVPKMSSIRSSDVVDERQAPRDNAQ